MDRQLGTKCILAPALSHLSRCQGSSLVGQGFSTPAVHQNHLVEVAKPMTQRFSSSRYRLGVGHLYV